MLSLNKNYRFSFQQVNKQSLKSVQDKNNNDNDKGCHKPGFNEKIGGLQFYYSPIISFKEMFRIPDEKYTEIKSILNTASDNLIQKKPSWDVKKPNVWMVSAETSTFMKTGGLASVAVDLSMAYNNFYKKSTGSKMTIVQPLYLMGDLVTYNPNTGIYESKVQNSNIKLTNTGETIAMPIDNNGKTESFEVLKGYHKPTNTDYIFIKKDKYFGNFTVDKKVNPYAKNNAGVGESERFAFFSKAVAYYVKTLKERNSEDTPNVIDANDWHAGPISAILKYLLPAKAICNDGVKQETADYLKKLPVVYTIHNLLYQGWDYPNTSKILNMLYDNFADIIQKEGISSHVQTKDNPVNKTTYVRDTYNASVHGLCLSDVVTAVSPNYAKETSTEKAFGYDFVNLLAKRHSNGNLTGIVNGIDPDDNLPKGKYSKTIHNHLHWFSNYDKTMNIEQIIKTKQRNKREFIKYLHDNYSLSFPQLDVKDRQFNKKVAKTPLLTMVTRLDEQKGIDMMLFAVKQAFESAKEKKQPLPVVAILGTDTDEKNPVYAKMINKFKNELPKEFADNFVFFDERNRELAFLLESSGDIFLMPSKFEPCGLSQFESMAKGTLPVATDTGGLHDTINNNVTGFLSKYFPDDPEKPQNQAISKILYSKRLIDALNVFNNNRKQFNQMAYNAMQVDSSWEKNGSLEKYHNLFMTGNVEGKQEN